MTNNILLLDIDGVVSPLYNFKGDDYILVPVGYATWKIPFKTVNMILDVAESENKIVWESTWEDVSNRINQSLDIEDFQYLEYSNNNSDIWFKFDSVKKFLKTCPKGCQIVWVDDEIPEEIVEWSHGQSGLVCVVPDGREGLTDNEIEFIKNILFS